MSSACVLPFFGGELAAFDPTDANCIERTDTGTYDSAFARCAISVVGNFSNCTSPTWAEASTFYFHEKLYLNDGNNWFGEVWTHAFFNAAGTVVYRMTAQYNHTTSSIYNFYTLQSGTATLVGSLILPTALNTIDVRLIGNSASAGRLTVWVNGTQRLDVTGLNHSGFNGVAQVSLRGSYVLPGTGYAYHSEIICDSTPHIGDRLFTYPINTNSAANTGWSGTVGNINEVVLSDNAFVSAASASLVSTYFASGFSLGTYNVVAVGVAARMNCGAAGPQNVQMAIRTGGANYFSPTIAATLGYQATFNSWTTNPNTGSAWLAANAQGVEGGHQSIA